MSALMKSLAAILLTSLAAAPLAGQMTIGLRGGIGTATLSRDVPRLERGEEGSRFGVVSGIDVGIPLSGVVDLRVGVGLAQKGGGADPPPWLAAGRAFIDATAELDYLQLSALFRASADAERGLLTVGVLAGPYVAVNHSCDISVRTLFSPPGSGEYRFYTEFLPSRAEASCVDYAGTDFASTDFGLAFGTGVEVRLYDSIALAFDLIYGIGLSRIDDDGTRNRHLALQSGFVLVVG
ncbi:outer membrane beta-barrel protein [Candidatus Palauibacter soopunensis]|uniref:outer membrane beta-barrel protein n=1 Tax=Candidatus Palauibacter soopunensis TaxID=3056739 RepID=UPI00239751DF|nr:outer membrane beta-barrel protein [Candidatus Palauibacter soopunensis]MDE2879239.1 outer membrane beta-barrel protein [Candidatus Palauibacter soopunensis]